VLLLGSNALFIATSFAVATWVNRRLGLSSVGDSAVVFARTGKHNGMAIAIAIAPWRSRPWPPPCGDHADLPVAAAESATTDSAADSVDPFVMGTAHGGHGWIR
jgi:hypothetical protein